MRSLVLCCALAGCGLGGDAGGGSANLPVSGVGPYRKLVDLERDTPLEEPFLVIDGAADLSDPCAVMIDGRFRMFYARTVPGADVEIWRVDVAASLRELDGDPALALAEAGGASAPSVVDLGGDHMVMFFQDQGGVGRADSTDAGLTWSRTGGVLDDAAQPSAVLARGDLYLYHTRPSEPGVFLARSSDGERFVDEPGPVLDLPGLVEPQAVGGVTAAGDLHIGLVYALVNDRGVAAIHYAGSNDGAIFEADPSAIVDPYEPSERAPSIVLQPTWSLLLFMQARTPHAGIAAATDP